MTGDGGRVYAGRRKWLTVQTAACNLYLMDATVVLDYHLFRTALTGKLRTVGLTVIKNINCILSAFFLRVQKAHFNVVNKFYCHC